MSDYVPQNAVQRGTLITFFHLKKTAVEAHRSLVEAYGDHALSRSQCYAWYERFGRGNFDIENESRGRPPQKFNDEELEELLAQDNTQTQDELAEALGVTRSAISKRLHALGKIQKLGRWVPHSLTFSQKMRRLTVCKELLERYQKKSFLHRIVTGDEKWIFYDNPKRRASWVNPGEAAAPIVRPKRFGKKTMLCVFWDQAGLVYYELLQPGETVDAPCYQRQLSSLEQAVRQKRPQSRLSREKPLLLHDNAPAHRARPTRETLDASIFEVLSHPPYSPDLAPSDYHLFASMGHALKEQRFSNSEEVGNWLDSWFASKDGDFFRHGIRALPQRWANCIAKEGDYFE